jgi:hypothetical protein
VKNIAIKLMQEAEVDTKRTYSINANLFEELMKLIVGPDESNFKNLIAGRQSALEYWEAI